MEKKTISNSKQLNKTHEKLWLKATDAFSGGHYEFTVSLLRAVVKEVPWFLDARKLTRRAAGLKQKNKGRKLLVSKRLPGKIGGLVQSDPHEAMAQLEVFLENDPHHITANRTLFDAAVRASLDDTATFALETIVAGHSRNTREMHALAERYLATSLQQEAVDTYRAILRIDPTDHHAITGEKNALAQLSIQENKGFQTGNLSDSVVDKRGTTKNPDELGLTDEQIHAEILACLKILETTPEDLLVTTQVAEYYERVKDWHNAIRYFRKATELSEGDPSLQRKLEDAIDQESLAAQRRLEDRIASDPESSDLEGMRSELEKLKKDQAQRIVDQAAHRVACHPTDLELRYELGILLYNQGNANDAIPSLQRAAKSPHRQIQAMLILGKCYDAKGMLDMASEILERAIVRLEEMDETKMELIYQLGLVHEKTGRNDQALRAFKDIYHEDCEFRDVAERVEREYR